MAAAAHLKTQTHTQTHSKLNKRRKHRETTISTSASSSSSSDLHHPIIVSSPQTSWCCSTSAPPQDQEKYPTSSSSSSSTSSLTLKFRFSPGRVSPVMDTSNSSSSTAPFGVVGGVGVTPYNNSSYPSSYTDFNSALNAGLLNPLSPPPPPPLLDKARSPTLFEMMSKEVDCHPKSQMPTYNNNNNHIPIMNGKPPHPISVQDKQVLLQQRLAEMVGNISPGNQFNDPVSSDVKLTLSSNDGLSVSMNVHRQILVAHSRYFAAELTDSWSKQRRSLPHIVEISDCEDVEVYIETLRLMYCKDIRRKLMKEDVPKVLAILKVCAEIVFEAGVLSCLEYLEAVPWAEDEEEKIALLLSRLHLEAVGAGEVLKRVSAEIVAEPEEGCNNEEVLYKLLQVVLEGKDEKARREMKGLVLKMLRENSSQNDLSKESLYSACDGCLQLLRSHFIRAATSSSLDSNDVNQIVRQADNLHWILDIMIDRQIADDFLKTWADQSELSQLHSKVPAIHRYEVSRVTARLFVGIGKGQLVASKEVRCMLLRTWLEPFYDDFGWMRRASNGLDRHLIEDGLSNTILTLPLAWQQEILLAWFDRFLNSGEDCPNIQRGFQVWWRRAFWRRYGESEQRRL
ncbi:hypothetical protein IFM89_024667 [Coptis chinensis]|uniref:BTB domain-containing protein n=1 Tax=Coptis chinensis TaxID=261450 RepID=A0A835M0Y2_9MAGN|nr:hypothetical protein IFM89_024667 [Coptis chinensis]